jgi:hypothetical protein
MFRNMLLFPSLEIDMMSIAAVGCIYKHSQFLEIEGNGPQETSCILKYNLWQHCPLWWRQ